MAMMALGMFVFEIGTLPYQELQHQLGWRHPSTSRVGSRPARQFLGPDDETVTLTGVLLPEITGGRKSLELVRQMGDQGKAWPLVDGGGDIHGMFVIESLSQTRSVFFQDGTPRRIEFSLTLKRADNDQVDRLGQLTSTIMSLL